MKSPSSLTAQIAFTLVILCAKAALSQQNADPLAEARALLAEGKLVDSETSIRKYLRGYTNSADAHFLLGYVLFREQKPKDSLAEFTAGAAIRRPVADDLKTVASDYVLLGAFADADRWFSEVLSENPQDVDVWYLLGRTKYNEGRYGEAASSFQRALALRPKYIEAENNLGLCRRELNDLDQAKAAFQNAIDWQGSLPSDSQPYLNLGTLLVDQGDYETAVRHLSRAAALSPDNPKIHEELGIAYEAQGNLPKAQAEFERAIVLAPNTPGLHFKLASLYRKEGLRDLARHEFEICAKLNSTHSSPETPNPFLPNSAAPH
jgi:Flp pilus assembly protein TadD